jgi:hypothetical protein
LAAPEAISVGSDRMSHVPRERPISLGALGEAVGALELKEARCALRQR